VSCRRSTRRASSVEHVPEQQRCTSPRDAASDQVKASSRAIYAPAIRTRCRAESRVGGSAAQPGDVYGSRWWGRPEGAVPAFPLIRFLGPPWRAGSQFCPGASPGLPEPGPSGFRTGPRVSPRRYRARIDTTSVTPIQAMTAPTTRKDVTLRRIRTSGSSAASRFQGQIRSMRWGRLRRSRIPLSVRLPRFNAVTRPTAITQSPQMMFTVFPFTVPVPHAEVRTTHCGSWEQARAEGVGDARQAEGE
jgi:hypothetical protein